MPNVLVIFLVSQNGLKNASKWPKREGNIHTYRHKDGQTDITYIQFENDQHQRGTPCSPKSSPPLEGEMLRFFYCSNC